MLKMRKFFLISLLICVGYTAHAEVAVPSLNSRVTDLSNTLTAEQKNHIEQKLTALEQTEGSQVAVLIIPTTKPESIEGFSLRVVDKWKLGRKNIDDGILLTIAKNDRKVRIEVGDGLEGAITDISAGRIINEYITPEFRQGRFYEGVLAGTGQIENLIKGEALPAPSTTQGTNSESSIFFLVFAASFVAPILTSLLGRILTISAITVGGTAFIWLSSQNIELTILGAILLGVFSFAFSAPRSSSYRDGGGHGGGFGGGGFGGGSSGGGFSGGGGGFSGGGASGGW
jgi:uncharacterized protein